MNQTKNRERSPEEDFESFYTKFNKDLSFQNSRTKYPLKGKYYTPTNKNPAFDYYFTLNDHLDFDNHTLDTAVYKINRIRRARVVEETMFIPNSEFLTRYTFRLYEEKWFLDYYEEHDED